MRKKPYFNSTSLEILRKRGEAIGVLLSTNAILLLSNVMESLVLNESTIMDFERERHRDSALFMSQSCKTLQSSPSLTNLGFDMSVGEYDDPNDLDMRSTISSATSKLLGKDLSPASTARTLCARSSEVPVRRIVRIDFANVAIRTATMVWKPDSKTTTVVTRGSLCNLRTLAKVPIRRSIDSRTQTGYGKPRDYW